MSVALIVTRGYGNGTLAGTIADVVTRGYSIGAEAASTFVSGIEDKWRAPYAPTKWAAEYQPLKWKYER